MNRDRIDVAIHAQLDRMIRLLRKVDQDGGIGYWRRLFASGHKMPTIRSAVRSNYLTAKGPAYTLTKSGRNYLADMDRAALMRA